MCADCVVGCAKMACQGLQGGESLASLKRESDNLKKKLDEERNKLNDVECKSRQTHGDSIVTIWQTLPVIKGGETTVSVFGS